MPPKLRDRVGFWKKIYSRYTTDQVVIHDRDNLGIIYEVVDLSRKFRNPKPGSSHVRRYIKKRKRRISSILKRLYRNKGKPASREDRLIAAKFTGVRGYKKYFKAMRNVRSQLGQADRFREGLKLSGLYIDRMRSIFRSYGLPEELTALPHVESSFNYNAYSSAGAAGIWQFTRSTGRLFLRINYTVDERRDPIISTRAAAKLLKRNYEELGSWPLAITAYNHGLSGMLRAKKKYGKNIAVIIQRYRSRIFGFASRNFYAEFLAALEVSRNYIRYFGDIDFLPASRYEEVTVTSYLPAKKLADRLGVTIDTMRKYNRSLRNSVWKGHRYIPKGFRLRTPEGMSARYSAAIAAISGTHGHSAQKHNGFHHVMRGDTLSTIARRYKSSVYAIRDINQLSSSLIRVGQKLRIPGNARGGATRGTTKSGAYDSSPVTGGNYRVKRGDNLSSIARRYGTTAAALIRVNGLSRPTIYPGQKLALTGRQPGVVDASFDTGSSDDRVASDGDASPGGAPADAVAEVPTLDAINIGDGQKPALTAKFFAIELVRDNIGRLTVRPEETLGHYAEWLKVPVRSLLKLNRRKGIRRNLRIGESVEVPLTRVDRKEFETRRLEYHMRLFEDFFDVYKVEESKVVTIKRNQSLWDLSVKEHGAPLWLVQIYNPGIQLNKVKHGMAINMPTVVKK